MLFNNPDVSSYGDRKSERGLRSVKNEYKAIQIKAAAKLYENPDPTMQTKVRDVEEIMYQRPWDISY